MELTEKMNRINHSNMWINSKKILGVYHSSYGMVAEKAKYNRQQYIYEVLHYIRMKFNSGVHSYYHANENKEKSLQQEIFISKMKQQKDI